MNKNGIYFSSVLLGCVIPLTTALADEDHHEHNKICQGSAPPILETADFDGNGIVNQNDIVLLKKAKKREIYYAFYDINADGKINRQDIRQAQSDLGKSSSSLDQQKAILFHQVSQFQLTDSKQELAATRYNEIAGSLAGHGEHWFYNLPSSPDNPYRPGGINYSKDDNSAKGVFWSVDALPVFENGATDYPAPGGDWMTSRVIAFAGAAPKLTESPDEHWHTHAGLCVTAQMGASGPEPVLNQHTSFAECQAQPTLFKTAGEVNAWFNIWMLHGWMFDLNPAGFFANTHACLDQNSPAEHTINGGRTVPEFFMMHHGG